MSRELIARLERNPFTVEARNSYIMKREILAKPEKNFLQPKPGSHSVETARRAVPTNSLHWFSCGSAALCLCLSLLLSGCAHQEESTPKVVVEVKVERVQVADVQISVRAPAAIHPREQANIASRVT